MTADVLVLQSKFDQEETLALIEKHRIDNAVMVPTMFVRMLKLPPEVRNRYDVRSLRWVTHTGAVSARGEEGSDGLVGSRGLRDLRRH
jgi:long-chain acyl-CoA synthetase